MLIKDWTSCEQMPFEKMEETLKSRSFFAVTAQQMWNIDFKKWSVKNDCDECCLRLEGGETNDPLAGDNLNVFSVSLVSVTQPVFKCSFHFPFWESVFRIIIMKSSSLTKVLSPHPPPLLQSWAVSGSSFTPLWAPVRLRVMPVSELRTFS